MIDTILYHHIPSQASFKSAELYLDYEDRKYLEDKLELILGELSFNSYSERVFAAKMFKMGYLFNFFKELK